MADLVPYIYHEQQERNGSMLCAQHCLNNLLQQSIYSEVDLSDLARQLDAQENSALDEDSQSKESQNMDDTGFFSLSVIENALQVWGLTLERWRGESMRAEHDRPELQSGFILNLSSHWLPIRRFGTSNRWYNLNSFLAAPEWISPTGLAMVLEASETEGYSVFVLRGLDGGIGVLPESQADLVALELGEPQGRMGGGGGATSAATAGKPESSYAAVASSSSATPPASAQPTADSSAESSDPVAASLARSRAQLEAFQREQAAALQNGMGGGRARRRRQADVPRLPGDVDEDENEDDLAPAPAQARPQAEMNRFQRQRAEEEEMMRRAIEASLQEARERGEAAETGEGTTNNADSTGRAEPKFPVAPAQRVGREGERVADVMDLDEELDDDEPAYDLLADQRHYDDEDAALQAALTASLADAESAGLTLPVQQPLRRPSAPLPMQPVIDAAGSPDAGPDNTSKDIPAISKAQDQTMDDDDDDDYEPEAEELTAEELRRRRLERFK